jgi:hypothetical protein
MGQAEEHRAERVAICERLSHPPASNRRPTLDLDSKGEIFMSSRFRNCLPLVLFSLPLIISTRTQVPAKELENGQEWLSWTPTARSAYVGGFVSGYLTGSHKTCLATDDIFEVGKPHRLEEQPSARCDARLDTYSKFQYLNSAQDFSAYTTVITDFYIKHPEYNGIPFGYLMVHLSDREYKTADELYKMALNGEIRTRF